MGVLNYNPWILVVVIPDRFIKFINKLSGVTETIDSKGHPITCRQEIYLFPGFYWSQGRFCIY